VGGGLARMNVRMSLESHGGPTLRSPLASGDTGPFFLGGDHAFGYWADTGVLFRAGDHANFGIDVRYSSANVTLNSTSAPFGQPPAQDVRAAGLSYGLLIGGAW